VPILENFLAENYGFEIVYQNKFPTGTIDFSSYFAAVESSEAQILYTWVISNDGLILAKEWYDRQSPLVLWGANVYLGQPDAWNVTAGKCEHTTNTGAATFVGYPFTSETIPFREAYLERWEEIPSGQATYAYDTLRFILPDAIERAGTIETEAVINALEDTSVETTVARNFVYTSSHDTLGGETINNPAEDHLIVMLFQWQNGQQIPVYPKKIMEEIGATYTFPDWPGPWDNIN
jgi:branched-chain amino acid transport system substrate-binding protein